MSCILIVDDDADLLEGQRLFLESSGYTVQTAAGMNEGLVAVQTFTPDLILADLMMEQYDSGILFCRKIKEMPGLEHIPILMQTAAGKEIGYNFDSGQNVREWMTVDEILIKPVPPDTLLTKIKHYLSV